MKLTLLGTGGYFPNLRRHTACFLLPDAGIVLDAGSGICRLGNVLQTNRLEVFLTHAHLDHVAGLTYLINVVPEEVLSNTTIHGEESKLAAVREHLFAEPIFPVPPPFRFQPLPAGALKLPDGGQLSHFPLVHPGASLGFRLDWPAHSLAYITDTTATEDAPYLSKIGGVDLLLHEAYFADDRDGLPALTGHSSLPTVAKLAAAAEVKQLVLIHIDPRVEDDGHYDLAAARRHFANIHMGRDGMEVEF
jgi:ribonuclease BN (tRNA processing enzyme)